MADVTDLPLTHLPRSSHPAPLGLNTSDLDVRDDSVLAALPTPPRTGTRIVLWSGSLDPGDAPTPRNWTAAAWEALDAATARWVDAGLADAMLVRPHARHIVSDIPSATRFARRWGRTGPRLLWDPCMMLEGPMTEPAHAATHLERLIDALEHPDLARGVEAVALAFGRGPWDSSLIDQAKRRCELLGVRVIG